MLNLIEVLARLKNAPKKGEVIDGITIQHQIARGYSFLVYHALHEGVEIAFKILIPAWQGDRDMLNLVQMEADVLSRVQHPNIPKYLGRGADRGSPYLLEELIRGVTLNSFAKKYLGPAHTPHLPIAIASKLFLPVCDALGALHQVGIVHRDVKPSNIVLEQVDASSRVVLVDYGGCQFSGNKMGHPTGENLWAGTLGFQAPEVVQAKTATPASDTFSVGASIINLVFGWSTAYGDVTCTEVILRERARDGAVQPVPTLPGLPSEFIHLLAKTIQPDPANRFQTASELRAALEPFATECPLVIL